MDEEVKQDEQTQDTVEQAGIPIEEIANPVEEPSEPEVIEDSKKSDTAETCGECNGEGLTADKLNLCPKCNGKGKI